MALIEYFIYTKLKDIELDNNANKRTSYKIINVLDENDLTEEEFIE